MRSRKTPFALRIWCASYCPESKPGNHLRKALDSPALLFAPRGSLHGDRRSARVTAGVFVGASARDEEEKKPVQDSWSRHPRLSSSVQCETVAPPHSRQSRSDENRDHMTVRDFRVTDPYRAPLRSPRKKPATDVTASMASQQGWLLSNPVASSPGLGANGNPGAA